MRILLRVFGILIVISALFLCSNCDEDSNPAQSLPTGCQTQGINAIAVLQNEITCTPTNAFKDPEEALGPSDGRSTGDGKLEFDGFASLGVEGSLTVYMGSCIQDLAGADLRVFQTVSDESVEVQVSQNENGPFTSLGTKRCDHFCDFDLAGSALTNVRIVKVIDRASDQFALAQCDNVGPSPGADLDAVEVLH